MQIPRALCWAATVLTMSAEHSSKQSRNIHRSYLSVTTRPEGLQVVWGVEMLWEGQPPLDAPTLLQGCCHLYQLLGGGCDDRDRPRWR